MQVTCNVCTGVRISNLVVATGVSASCEPVHLLVPHDSAAPLLPGDGSKN